MALQHGGARAVQLCLERGHQARVVVTDIVDTVARDEVQDHPAVRCVKLRARASEVGDVHLQSVEKLHPLRVDVVSIGIRDFGLYA